MKKVFSPPNFAIGLACFAWIIAYYAALVALGDLKPADPNLPADKIRFEQQIQKKDINVKTSLAISIIFAVGPYFLAFKRWKNAKIRFSLSLLICSPYLGAAVYLILTI